MSHAIRGYLGFCEEILQDASPRHAMHDCHVLTKLFLGDSLGIDAGFARVTRPPSKISIWLPSNEGGLVDAARVQDAIKAEVVKEDNLKKLKKS